MKVSRKLLKNTGKVIAILVLIPILIFLIYSVVRVSGKNKLYKEAKSNKETEAPIVNSLPQSIEVEVVEEDDSYDWKEGDLRYNGNIYRYNDEILTFLIMGIDKKGKVYKGEVTDYIDGGQADALFLAIINPKSEEISIVAINRNTMTDVDVYNSDGSFNETRKLQITLQHGYGDGRELSCERQRDVVSKLFMNIPIHGYASINMGAISEINDAVGGVPVVIEENSAYKSDNLKNNVGKEVVLKGKDAYEYIHNRDVKEFDSAGKRLNRQKQYLSSFINKAKAKTKQSILLLFLIALSLGSGKIGIKLVSYVFQFTLWFYIGMLFEKNRSIFEDTFSDIKFRLLLADIVLYVIYEIANYFLMPFPIKIIMKVEKIILTGLLCLTVYMISYFVTKSKIFNSRVFNVLRRDSFGIYLYSDPLNYLILMVGASLFGGELWTNNLYSVAFYLFRILVTLGISICLTEVLKKCKIKYIC